MKTKEVRGITIISLVVTIVVLLILAGVSVSVVIGNNNLFDKAKSTQKVQTIAGISRVCEFLRRRLYKMVPEVPCNSTSKMMQSGLQLLTRCRLSSQLDATLTW